MGRRKIEMEKVQDMNTRQVTFSKRRTGLFKKASELATLCNAEVGIVVFSPGGKPFSYGKPSVEAVTERFINDFEETGSGCNDETRVRKRDKQDEIIENLDRLTKQLKAEKKRGEMLQENLESAGYERFLKPVEELSLDELKEYKSVLQAMHDEIKGRATQMKASSTLMLLSADNGSCNAANDDDDYDDDDN
ncbi:PREDICTED: agamous-like MADS-box protein AGL29 [Tarenaya hassleriana]|uniref:agamous-like MADS-box protein AGL29 n=1 Tax=Tarenaya hassleriana TaxID=28532 RepID=UPI00053C1168|nr:PREDICTED: agamous-like MADS-box protein AGL29 [Tarenaya hassleriana]